VGSKTINIGDGANLVSGNGVVTVNIATGNSTVAGGKLFTLLMVLLLLLDITQFRLVQVRQ